MLQTALQLVSHARVALEVGVGVCIPMRKSLFLVFDLLRGVYLAKRRQMATVHGPMFVFDVNALPESRA